jgi:hypothetical protein
MRKKRLMKEMFLIYVEHRATLYQMLAKCLGKQTYNIVVLKQVRYCIYYPVDLMDGRM